MRNAAKGTSISGNRSSRSSGLTRFPLISALKASPPSRSNSFFVGASAVNLDIASIF